MQGTHRRSARYDGDPGNRYPRTSPQGGQQQRVAIAVALANEPEVLFADEPTGELDAANSQLVFDAMREVNARLGVTVLIVTHDETVSTHVRRTVQIRDGRTSTEVLHAQEYPVLDRVGRLRFPREYLTALELRERVRLELEPDHVQVHPIRPGEREER